MKDLQAAQIPGFYRHEGVAEDCLPFAHLEGHDRVVVFFHGFTGSPHDFRNYALPYVAAGFDVVVPLIPGHGSHISRLERLGFRELYIPFEPLADWLMPRYRQVHLVSLSYGAILTTQLALNRPDRPFTTMSYLAPAFFLTADSERSLALVQRLRLYLVKGRVAKTTASRDRAFRPHPYTYAEIPFRPATELLTRARQIRAQLQGLPWSVFHGHGDADDTTPLLENRALLAHSFADYTFHRVRNGTHVLPLSVGADELARAHIAWLEAHA